LQNPIQILDDIVVPYPDHAITEIAEFGAALPVFEASCMLAPIKLDK
jgi:hypothetical protein